PGGVQAAPAQPAKETRGERVAGPDGVRDAHLEAGTVDGRGSGPEEARTVRAVGHDHHESAEVQPAAADVLLVRSRVEPADVFPAGLDDVRHADETLDERACLPGLAEQRGADVGIVADHYLAVAVQSRRRGEDALVSRGSPGRE